MCLEFPPRRWLRVLLPEKDVFLEKKPTLFALLLQPLIDYNPPKNLDMDLNIPLPAWVQTQKTHFW